MKNLISTTDMILEVENYVHESHNAERGFELVLRYAKFIKQPLNLGMFVPVDEDGNILFSKPNYYDCFLNGSYVNHPQLINYENCVRYKKAEENVLFKGFIIRDKGNFFFIEKNNSIKFRRVLKKNTKSNVQDLLNTWHDVELTDSAIEQLTA